MPEASEVCRATPAGRERGQKDVTGGLVVQFRGRALEWHQVNVTVGWRLRRFGVKPYASF